MNELEALALADEVRAVCLLLENALDELYAPLSDLARANLRASDPPLRALAVLATGVRDDLQDDEKAALRERRILLAAALEMLAVALQIHGLLLAATTAAATVANGAGDTQESTHELDRSLAGSTILTGDYCFSRAAVLAAQTNSATVVDIFSQALKNVSEGRLRRFFSSASAADVESTHPDTHNDEESIELVRAGVRGAAHMAALAPAQAEGARLLAVALATGKLTPTAIAAEAALTREQRARWQAAWHIVMEKPHPDAL